MSYHERDRRTRSNIPRTSVDVLRGRVAIQIGGGSLSGGARSASRAPTAEADWGQIVAEFQKPQRREKARPEPPYEGDDKIGCEAEVVENYNNQGDLGVIFQFDGIRLTGAPFLRSKHNSPDSPVFYIPIGYNEKMARLFLATRGDIFESQIVPAQMDVNPFFQGELYLPQLTTTHDPTSMAVSQNNKLVTVSYNPRIY